MRANHFTKPVFIFFLIMPSGISAGFATVALPDLGLATSTDLTGSYGFAAGTPAGATTLNAVKTGFADYSTTVVLLDDEPVTKNFQMSPV